MVTEEGVEEPGALPPRRSRLEYLERFVGPNWDGYRRIAEKLTEGQFSIGWSWSAFFFNILWLAYRRRFSWAAIAFLGPIAVPWLVHDASEIFGTVVALFIGIFSKSLYLKFALNRVDQILAETQDERERLAKIDFAGGVDSNAVVVALFLAAAVGMAFVVYVSSVALP